MVELDVSAVVVVSVVSTVSVITVRTTAIIIVDCGIAIAKDKIERFLHFCGLFASLFICIAILFETPDAI